MVSDTITDNGVCLFFSQKANAEQEEEGCQVRLLVIIPAYNEQGNILKTVQDLRTHCPEADCLVVNDCSEDETRELLRKEGIPHLDLPVNLGIGGAVQSGYLYGVEHGYDIAVQFDGDGQHRAEDIKSLYEKMKEGDYDIVQGSRFLERKKGGSMREIGSRLISMAIKITTGKTITDPTCGLRMYSGRVIDSFANRLNYGPEPDTISFLIKQGAKVTEAPVTIDERLAGESYLKPMNAMKYMARMLISILVIQSSR